MAFVTGAVMTIGLVAREPAGSRATGPAALAGVVMDLAPCIDTSLFASLLRVLEVARTSAGFGGISAARKSFEAAQSLSTWGSLARCVCLGGSEIVLDTTSPASRRPIER